MFSRSIKFTWPFRDREGINCRLKPNCSVAVSAEKSSMESDAHWPLAWSTFLLSPVIYLTLIGMFLSKVCMPPTCPQPLQCKPKSLFFFSLQEKIGPFVFAEGNYATSRSSSTRSSVLIATVLRKMVLPFS